MHTIYYSFFHVRYIYLSLFRLPCCFLFLAILYTFPYPTNPLPIQWRYTVPCTLFIYNLLITLYPCVTFHRKDSSMCMYVCVYNRVNMSQKNYSMERGWMWYDPQLLSECASYSTPKQKVMQGPYQELTSGDQEHHLSLVCNVSVTHIMHSGCWALPMHCSMH